jgi:membrane dipeptidase
MELHKESLVFDTYGFQPTAALDSERMNALINAGASSLEIQDMRENMMMTNYINNPAEREEFENAWTASGVTCVFQKCRRRK